MLRTLVTLLSLAVITADCFIAVDVSTLVSSKSSSCFKQSVNAVFVRLLRSNGQIDTIGLASLDNLLQVDMPVAVYAYPNIQGDPEAQASAVVTNVKRLQSSYVPAVAVDVEGKWTSNTTQNCDFLVTFINTLLDSSLRVLVYSNWNNWASIFGSTQSCEVSDKVPYLWYAHYDGLRTFSDFKPFAGWTSPLLKQYAQNVEMCGMQVDLNWSQQN